MSTPETATAVKGALSGLAAAPATQAAGSAGTAVAPSGVGSALSAAETLARSDNVFSWSGYFQALAILFLIIAALWAALWYLKSKGGIKRLTGQGDLFVESRLALGPKKFLLVVRFLNKRVLLGVTDQRITMLTELPANEDVTERNAPNPGTVADFKAHFDNAAQKDADG